MLGARSVAVVGASPRPGSFGSRMVEEVLRSPSRPQVHLVTPRHASIDGRPCVPSLREVPEPVDLVLLGVPDEALVEQLAVAAERGDRSAVVFGSAHGPVRDELASVARSAGLAVCGPGCMGFVVADGVRALGYLERDPLPAGPIALVSASGSAFSTLLRTRQGLGWTLAVSSGSEAVTTTADYVEAALDLRGTRVVALLLETVREPERLRAALARAAAQEVDVVLLPLGGSAAGASLVTAHSGAVAGADAAWEALADAYGLHRVTDLAEFTDTLELLSAVRRPRRRGGLASVHDSGAERVLVADSADRLGVPFTPLAARTRERLARLLDPGLEPANPLDVWGRGADTRELVGACLRAMADDPGVAVVALALDLVDEYDGDDSYPLAALDAAASAPAGVPVVVLSGLASALDPAQAALLRRHGVPVLEGTRSGLVALRALLRSAAPPPPSGPAPEPDRTRQERWRHRLARGPLGAAESYALLADYGVPAVAVVEVGEVEAAVEAARAMGWPVVLKTAEPTVAHKSDIGGVVVGLRDESEVRAAYADLAGRLGPPVLVAEAAQGGVELLLGLVRDPLLGPLVVVGAGGTLTELLQDRAVGLPPLAPGTARRMVDRLRCRPLLDAWRGRAAVDVDAVVGAVEALSTMALELGDALDALDVNPLVVSPTGAVGVDVLVVPRASPPAPERLVTL